MSASPDAPAVTTSPGPAWRPARLFDVVRDGRTWRELSYLFAAFPLAVAAFVWIVAGLATGIGLAITFLGLPIIILTIVGWRVLARIERVLHRELLGSPLAIPYRSRPEGLWARVGWLVGDPATWKDLAYLLAAFPLSIVALVVASLAVGLPLGLATAPLWSSAADGFVDTLPEAIVIAPIGVLLTIPAAWAVRGTASVFRLAGRLLLGSDPDPELTARVGELSTSRARLLAAGDAERRRIERDLHDGAQQRLVALALGLGMAKDKLAQDPEAAAVLVGEAHDEAQRALQELRDLARGIHPAILTDCGLGPAIEQLAGRSPVRVDVLALPAERLPESIEAAAYFVVSEALANVAKYARADLATVQAAVAGGALAVEVTDDGIGGADPEAGSGLRGLADRVGAFDGTLEIRSPPGGGTRLLATLPLPDRAD